jgi:hypothetical protein
MSTTGNYKSLTREEVEKVILYDPVEGSFFKKSTGNRIHINQYTEPNQTPFRAVHSTSAQSCVVIALRVSS